MPLALILFNFINVFVLRFKSYSSCKQWLNYNRSLEKPSYFSNSIIKFGAITTIGGTAWTIEATSDVFILSGTGYIALIGVYVLWWRFPQMFFDMATRLTNSALPSLNSSFGRSEEHSKNIFNKLLIVVGGVGFCIYVGITNWLPAFINLWVGERYFFDEFHFTSMLIGMLVYSRVVGNCLGMYTITIGKVNYTATLSWIQAIVKVILAIILVKQIGIVGLFIASIAGSFLQILGCTYLLIKRKALIIDVLILIVLGLLVPLVLIYFKISERYSVVNFSFGIFITVFFSSIIWILFVRILSLNKRLNFSFSTKTFLNNLK
jgi:O-antigen/teichoic acid export membrane protein